MKATKLGKIFGGQDGAVFGGFLFRFNEKGTCKVYKIEEISEVCEPFSQFELKDAGELIPHCNSVAFGSERFDADDEFPLLYSNIYNNYAKAENKLKGVTLIYRIQRSGSDFSAKLVGSIEIGFVEDSVWASEGGDTRPYGNFAIDTEKGIYYAFTMRDKDNAERYFSFNMPRLCDGKLDERLGIKRVVLQKEDIIDFFDCDYHHYVQGAIFNNGIIYSLEGFTDSSENPPAIRLIDPEKKVQKAVYYFGDIGLSIEPEFIDFEDGVCYYADNHGNAYTLTF